MFKRLLQDVIESTLGAGVEDSLSEPYIDCHPRDTKYILEACLWRYNDIHKANISLDDAQKILEEFYPGLYMEYKHWLDPEGELL